MPDVDVLIVGGGPTGLMLALELAIQKVSFRIIDKQPLRSDKSRALVVHPRTLELFNRHGIAHDLMSLGTIGTGARIFVNKKLAAELVLDDLGMDDTAFPLPLWISQVETEHLLDQALERHSYKVERPFTAESIEQDETGVNVLLRSEDGSSSENLRCKYVVGCDGAHSAVRHAANLTFEGGPYAADYLLADVHSSGFSDNKPPKMSFFLGQGMLVEFPLKDGLIRVFSTRPAGEAENDGLEHTLEDFQKMYNTMAPETPQLHDPVWISRFQLHHRCANKFRSGRLFIVGDAAHIHSPAGGQGMNTGIQDAANLGWKLASVIHGNSTPELSDALLDSYDIERHRVAENLLKGSDRLFQFGANKNPIYLFLRNFLVPWVAPWAFGTRERRAKMFRFTSQLGVRYRHSPIVGTGSAYRGPLKGGDRAPDGELQEPDGSTTNLLNLCFVSRHHLVVFSGKGAETVDDEVLRSHLDGFGKASGKDWAKSWRIFASKQEKEEQQHLQDSGPAFYDEDGKIHARYGFLVEPGYVLVRPDGYVAHIGLLRAMDEFLVWLKGYGSFIL